MSQNSLFKRIDIFGIPPHFTIRGRPTFQTNIGSFFILIFVFYLFKFKYSSTLIQKSIQA